jgi:hypothetical protein
MRLSKTHFIVSITGTFALGIYLAMSNSAPVQGPASREGVADNTSVTGYTPIRGSLERTRIDKRPNTVASDSDPRSSEGIVRDLTLITVEDDEFDYDEAYLGIDGMASYATDITYGEHNLMVLDIDPEDPITKELEAFRLPKIAIEEP